MARLKPDSLDDVIHGRIRLGVMAYLSQTGSASFSELAQALETTNGNLSIHLKKLDAADYIAIDKRFVKSKPLTTARMTESGRTAWRAYLDALGVLFHGDG
ncbi:winged helix-turn-helix domain-containing protein [Maricaulaceae bacterium MS644]